MYGRDVITLRSIKSFINEYGDPVELIDDTSVFADRMSVNSTEFYQAMEQDLKPSSKFKIRLVDYSNQKWFLYDGVEYKIIRSESPDSEFIILVGEGVI